MDSGHLLEEAVQERAGKYNSARTFFKSVKKKIIDLETAFCMVLN